VDGRAATDGGGVLDGQWPPTCSQKLPVQGSSLTQRLTHYAATLFSNLDGSAGLHIEARLLFSDHTETPEIAAFTAEVSPHERNGV